MTKYTVVTPVAETWAIIKRSLSVKWSIGADVHQAERDQLQPVPVALLLEQLDELEVEQQVTEREERIARDDGRVEPTHPDSAKPQEVRERSREPATARRFHEVPGRAHGTVEDRSSQGVSRALARELIVPLRAVRRDA